MRADRGFLRTLRAGVFAGAAVGLAAAAHEVGGGPVTAAGALTGFLAVLLVARPLAGRLRGAPAVLVATALAQGGLHLMFEAWSGGGSCAGGGHAVHAVHAVMRCSGGSPGSTMEHTGGGMALGHVIAALLLAVLLRSGERALWAFLTLLGLRPPPARALIRFVRARQAGFPAWATPRTEVPAPAISRRGPPVTVST